MDNIECSFSTKTRVPRDSYKILRQSFGSDQHQPEQALLETSSSSRKRRETICSKCFSLFLRCCSKVFVVFLVTLSLFYVVLSLEATAVIWRNSLASSLHLKLSPFIKDGNISEARALCKVSLFPGVKSYSGFLTVDETCKSHLFFWFFPASSGNVSAPLILWHGGGPGTSALLGLFQGTGPILLDPEGNTWKENQFSWTTHRSILYLDSPVGTGFSYSEYDEARCYASSSDDVADQAINALRQFYQMFPEYQPSDLYISTTSYGGKFAPSCMYRIHNDNQLDRLHGMPPSINLKGVISMSGFSDPIHQIDYGEFYYNMGLIDHLQLKYFQTQESHAKAFIRSRHYYDAYEIVDPLVIGGKHWTPSYLKNITGIKYPYNFGKDLSEPDAGKLLYRHEKFLNQRWVQEAIHVDVATVGRAFKSSSDVVYFNLLNDLYKSVARLLEELLDSGEYRFLLTSGQLDLIVPHTTISRFLQELKWGERTFMSMTNSRFATMPYSMWMFRGQVTGYSKTIGNLTYLMLRNAGHHPFIDQPEWTLDLILTFTDSQKSMTFK